MLDLQCSPAESAADPVGKANELLWPRRIGFDYLNRGCRRVGASYPRVDTRGSWGVIERHYLSSENVERIHLLSAATEPRPWRRR